MARSSSSTRVFAFVVLLFPRRRLLRPWQMPSFSIRVQRQTLGMCCAAGWAPLAEHGPRLRVSIHTSCNLQTSHCATNLLLEPPENLPGPKYAWQAISAFFVFWPWQIESRSPRKKFEKGTRRFRWNQALRLYEIGKADFLVDANADSWVKQWGIGGCDANDRYPEVENRRGTITGSHHSHHVSFPPQRATQGALSGK